MGYDRRLSVGFDHAQGGSTYLNAGTSVTGGRYFGLLVLNDAVLSSIAGRGNSTDDLSYLVGPTLLAGTYIPEALSGAAVTSGLVKLAKEPG